VTVNSPCQRSRA